MKAVLAFALVFPTLYTFGYFVYLADQQGAAQAVYVISKVIQFALPVVCIYLVDRQRLTWERPRWSDLRLGVGMGLLLLVAMLSLYHGWLKPAGFFHGPASAVREKVSGLGMTSPARYIAAGCFYALVHSLLEEYYWRWFVFRQLRTFQSMPLATTLSSLGFMSHHVIVLATFFGWQSPATYLFSAAVAIGGVIWAWLYEHSKSLAGPWIAHMLVDAGIFLIGYDMVCEMFV